MQQLTKIYVYLFVNALQSIVCFLENLVRVHRFVNALQSIVCFLENSVQLIMCSECNWTRPLLCGFNGRWAAALLPTADP
jgi:hypothetical protein